MGIFIVGFCIEFEPRCDKSCQSFQPGKTQTSLNSPKSKQKFVVKFCSAQSKNRYNSGIVLRKVGIPTLSVDSGIVPDISRIVQGIYIVLSSDMVCAQSRNRFGQNKNTKGSANRE